jgi:TolA-binding protein
VRWLIIPIILFLSSCGGEIDTKVRVIEDRLTLLEKRLDNLEKRVTSMENSTDSGLEMRLSDIESKLMVIEERVIYNETLLDELTARISVVEDLVYKVLPKYSEERAPSVVWDSQVLSKYAKAYSSWYKGDYKDAVARFKEFLSISNDRFLNLQSYILIADSLYKLGDKEGACEFVEKLKSSSYNFLKETVDSLEEKIGCKKR